MKLLACIICLAAAPMISLGQVSTCQGVYADAVRNVDVSSRLLVEQSSIFTQHCEANGSLKSSSSKLDLAIPVKTVTAKVGLSQEQTQQEMQQFCKTYSDARYRYENTFRMSNTVVTDALRSYNQCIELEQKNVRIVHTANTSSMAVRVVFNPSTDVVVVNSVQYDESTATCTSNIGKGGTRPITFKTGTLKANAPFAISCSRKPEVTSDGTRKFPRLEFLLSTNQGDYTVALPTEEMLNYDLASKNRTAIETLTVNNQNLVSANSALTASNQSLSTANTTSIAKLASPRAEVFIVTQGQASEIPCAGDQNKYIRDSCPAPGVLTPIAKTPEVHGGACGYRAWKWACVTYP